MPPRSDLEAGSPAWWLDLLEEEIDRGAGELQTLDDWYSGNHPLPFLTKSHTAKMRDEFRGLLEDSKSNFMRLVVEAVEERLRVDGFRLSASTDPVADQATWAIWQANGMDEQSSIAFTEALIKGRSYISVWGDGEEATLAVEDPSQTAVAYVPGSGYRLRAAAAKVWDDDSGDRRANVYLPEGIYKFVAPDATSGVTDRAVGVFSWREVEEAFEPNPTGKVPIVPLRNRPRILSEGASELAGLTEIQGRANALTFLLALGGYFGAHRQRWAVGVTLHEDAQGNPVEPFNAAVDKLWVAENATDEQGGQVRFGEFSQTDLGGYIDAIEQAILHIAVISRTPRHYLVADGQSPSGDALRSAEAGLVKKCEARQTTFGEGLEDALRLAREFAGEEESPPDSEVVWRDPQTETKAETTDAVLKQYAADLIPWEAAMEELGYSQTQIARYSAMRQQDALMRRLLEPEPPPPAPPAPAPEPPAA